MSLRAFNKRQGRIAHDLALYSTICATNPTFQDNQEDYGSGWETGRTNVIKQLIRGIFNSNVEGNIINVKNRPFTLYYQGGTYPFPAGIVSKINMGCFPYNTSVTVSGIGNILPQLFTNIGRLDHSTFGEK